MTAPATGKPRPTLELPAHIYRLDGEVIPGVTATLRAAGVIDYSMIPQEVLQAAAHRGTAVHQAMHLYAKGTLDPESIDPAIAGYVAAGIRFHEESRLTIAHAEQMVFHEQYRYAGMFDLDCVIEDELLLCDYKTGIVLDGHRAQLAAYLNCRPKPRRWRRAAVQLNEDGSYRVHEFPRADFDRDLDLFLWALAHQQTSLPGQNGGPIR
jgi:hypothetical protein